MKEKAILLISFGSSYEITRKRSIDQIVECIKENFTDYRVEYGFTSHYLRQKIERIENKKILGPTELLEVLLKDGIRKVYIQPTFIVEGIQYKKLVDQVLSYRKHFDVIKIGKPLLADEKDYAMLIQAITSQYKDLLPHEAVLCVGHGNEMQLSVSFAALDYMFKDYGYKQYYVATLRSYPKMANVLKKLKEQNYRRVYLLPLMVVAGYHAEYDLLGKVEIGWKHCFEQEGLKVESITKGLGEYIEIQQSYVEHIKDIIEEESFD